MLIHKDVFREIKNSTGRFVSLFLIVVLGVAFYAGIRSCSPDMLITADNFYDSSNLADIRIMSTLGITQDDIDAISKVEGVDKAYGSYTYDFLCKLGDTQYVVKMMGLTDGVNEIVLKSGTMPQKLNECLIDDYHMNMRGYKIGDTIELFSGDDTKIDDVISVSKYVISGTFVSSAYLSMSMGTSSIGSGSVEGLMMVRPEVFNLEVFTEADVIAKGAKEFNCYSEEYDARVDEVIDNIKTISDAQVEKRYNDIIGEARKELDKAKEEFEEGKAKYEDAKAKWEEGKQKLDEAKRQYNDGLAKVNNGWREIESKKPELEANKKLLQEKWAQFYAGEAELNAKMQEYINQKVAAEAEIANQEAQLARVEAAINAIIGPRTHDIIRKIIQHITGMDAPFEEYKSYVDYEDECVAGNRCCDYAEQILRELEEGTYGI